MGFKVYYDTQGVLSDTEFRNLAGKVTQGLNKAIGRLGRFRLDKAARGGKAKYFGEAAEGPAIIATYFETTDWLHIYLPVVKANPGLLDSMLVHELGHRLWYQHIPSYKRNLWNKKYIPANSRTIDRIQHLMKHRNYTKYMDLVDEFKDPNDRLVAIHIANALIVNKYPIKLLKELDIRDYPATREFCGGSKLYSVIPLVSAYAREADYEDYAETFRAYVESDGKLSMIREPSTRQALADLFEEVSS